MIDQTKLCRVAVLLFALCLAIPTAANAEKPSDDLVVFGDSLSDSGNFFTETGELLMAPYAPVPDAPYAIGGHHFSDGRTWIEQLAARLHVPRSAGPALRVPGVFTNYAFGRSRARANAPTFPFFDLSTQVNLFFADFGGQAPPNARFVIWSGSNDVRDALFALQVDPSGATTGAILESAIISIQNNIVALYGTGARKFLVLNVPNIGITPAVRALGALDPSIPVIAEQVSALYNAGLAQVLDGLGGFLDGVEILRLDTFAVLNAIVADPAAYGLTNVTDACLTFGVSNGAVCRGPKRFLFWDGAHPTTAGHGALAEAAAVVLAGQ